MNILLGIAFGITFGFLFSVGGVFVERFIEKTNKLWLFGIYVMVLTWGHAVLFSLCK